ncbi:uncharacterized protein [Primulina eburnea]|uniref:uncharacterized protein n=1 Tax=Primulina eburnea TaxID=1245227 RepID=UPI003C6C1C2E
MAAREQVHPHEERDEVDSGFGQMNPLPPPPMGQAPADQPLLPGELTLAQFSSYFPPRFDSSETGERAEEWIERIEQIFTTEAGLRAQGRTVDWDVFRSRFLDKYFSIAARQKKEKEFEDLRQGSMSVAEYESRYSALLKYVPHVATNVHAKMRHFLKGLKLELFDRVQSNNPISFEDAVTRAEMAELVMQEYGAQGRLSEPTRESLRPQGQSFKYQKGSSSSSASSGKRRFDSRRGESRGSSSQSVQGQRGESRAVRCFRCGGPHLIRDCTQTEITCFECGGVGHLARQCPSREGQREPRSARGRSSERGGRQPQQFTPRSSGGQPRMQGAGPPQAQVYALTREQAEEAREEMIAGASHTFISKRFVAEHHMRSSPLSMPLSVSTPSGVDISVRYCATVDCYRRVVYFYTDEKERWTFYGKGSRPRVPLVSAIRMSRLLEHGHEGYLIYAVDVTEKKKDVGIEEIPIVAEFVDVFPDEIPGFPPAHEVEFGIELMPGTSSISRTPYRMAPAELRELKAQLQDLLDKGYIRPSVSPWGHVISRDGISVDPTKVEAVLQWSAPTSVPEIRSTCCGICLETAETTRNKDYDCEIEYHPGRANLTADALSRKVSTLLAEPDIYGCIRDAQMTDERVQRWKELVSRKQDTHFRVADDGSLRMNDRWVVPDISELRQGLLRRAHCSRYSIHPGGKKMYKDLRSQFWWKGMKCDVIDFVRRCLNCQQIKAERRRPGGELKSLEVPTWKWEHISMDFVTHLPRSTGTIDAIWVIVDRLTKVPHFIPYSMSSTYLTMAQLYIREIVRLHGITVSIISDRDPRFTSHFWEGLQTAMGTELRLSTAYHPQTDGQTERTIQTLEDMLRAYVMDFKSVWQSYIPLVEFAYNNSYQSSIQMAPFEALYGRRCRSPLYWDDVDRAAVTGPDMIHEMEQKVKLIQQRLKAAQDRQAAYANKRRRPLEFQQGDRVFLKVSPFRGTVRFGMKGKLAPRYVGPYEILQRIGTLAYRLALPPSLSGIHDVFHVSMLRKYEPDPSHVLDISEVQLDPDVSYVERPVCILDRSERKLRNKLIPMVKVQWEHRGVEEATWETKRHMRELYPYLF